MRAIILAAGEGKRLRPYTSNKPKCMVEIEGKSLIDRQINVLNKNGIDDIIIIGGYKSEMLKGKGNKLLVNPRYHETNMVWTLFCAEDYLNEELVVSYGDIVYSADILSSLISSKNDISVTIDMNWEDYWRERNENPLDDAETLRISKDGSIEEIGQKPNSLAEIQGQYMGLLKFSPEGLRLLRDSFSNYKKNGLIMDKTCENAFMTDLLMQLIVDKIKIQSVKVFSPWIEVDTVDDLHASYTTKRIRMIENNM